MRLMALLVASLAIVLAAVGCGDDEPSAASPDSVQTLDPERTFAPLVELAGDEPWRPMAARWFIERALFGFTEDQGCPDRRIAVGRTRPAEQNAVTNWIFPKGLGVGPNYYRNPQDATCELNSDFTFYTDQLTRPHDPGDRVEGIRPGEGFFMDISDDARGGPPPGEPAPVYVERTDEGDASVRLSYWMLFGMHGEPGDPRAHEGDWERVDVLLRADGEDRYEPLAVQLVDGEAGTASTELSFREVAWDALRRVDSTHPVVAAARATHTLTAPSSEAAACADCEAWETWRDTASARDQLWYGFGGAWGQPGPSSATTGPLGPHSFFPSPAQKERDRYGDYLAR